MKFTKINRYGKKISKAGLESLVKTLVNELRIAGYITEGYVINSQCIKLGLHMRSFKVNVVTKGYNKNVHSGRRTSTPTWNQRVEYNNIVNAVLTKNNISAKVTSMHYVIRDGLIAKDEYDWQDQKQDWEYQNESRGYYVVSCA